MTRTEMLARVRTLLDEASASFWTDAEIYSALTDGQQEAANYFYSMYEKLKQVNPLIGLPHTLEPLYTLTTSTTINGLVNNPSNYWHLILATYAYNGGTSYNCRIQPLSPALLYDLDNTYLVASTTSPTVYQVSSTQFLFLPTASGTANYALGYIVKPTAISSSVDPVLPVLAHTAIVHYATAQMLFKDQRPQEAQLFLQNFINEIQVIG